jgi:hypothetical protein
MLHLDSFRKHACYHKALVAIPKVKAGNFNVEGILCYVRCPPMTHQVFKGWWGNVAKIAPRFQDGGGPYGVVQISGKLKKSWEEEPEKKHMNGAICGQF